MSDYRKHTARRFDPLPWAVAAFVVALAAFSGFVVGRASSGSPITLGVRHDGGVSVANDGRAEVETWLRENLNTGEWQEIQWWPARSYPKTGPPKFRIARMKYRTANDVGGMVVEDRVFRIEDGIADRYSKYHTISLAGYFD